MPRTVTFWGALASPFQLKMQAIADACQLEWRRLPAQANPAEAWTTLLRLRLGMRLGRIRRFSGFTAGGLVPPFLRKSLRRNVAARQTRRCAYLFSVAPQGYGSDLPRSLRAPASEGFPPTHKLLDTSWREYLAAMEGLLVRQPYLLGGRFTLADASAYGQLAMNLPDGRAADLLKELAPRTSAWLARIGDGEHHRAQASLEMTDALLPLLDCIHRTFIPLMQQNAAAFRPDAPRTNEAAFEACEQLYDGELMGHPFRAVCKTFQVRVWHDLCSQWAQLDDGSRRRLAALGVDGNWFTTAPRRERTT